jgi:hypothetical protein
MPWKNELLFEGSELILDIIGCCAAVAGGEEQIAEALSR